MYSEWSNLFIYGNARSRAWQPPLVFLPGESPWTEGAWWATVLEVAKQLSTQHIQSIKKIFFHKMTFILFMSNLLNVKKYKLTHFEYVFMAKTK